MIRIRHSRYVRTFIEGYFPNLRLKMELTFGKGERGGSRANGVKGIGISTGIIKRKSYYYNIRYYNLRVPKHMDISLCI